MQTISLTIDGKTIPAKEGQSVLSAALEAGVYIPHLCHHPDLPDIGECKLCVVEIDGGKTPVTSCTTPARDGMVVQTKSAQIDQLRQLSMELMLASHIEDCTTCPKYLKCELQSMIQYLGISASRMRHTLKSRPVNTENPLFVRDPDRCIACGRCVRMCNQVRGVKALDYRKEPNGETVIGYELGLSPDAAGCRYCSACVEVCPTGALRDKEGLIHDDVTRDLAYVPCKNGCPAHIDVPRYIRYIHEERYSDALAVIREKAPFPLSLGYVCMHFCEKNCRRGEVNDAVSIKQLKRFAAQNGSDEWKQKGFQKAQTGKKVAVIGAGPSGLTAAYYLAKLGHTVKVFETLPEAGGMMRYGIPEYRLPSAAVESEVQSIRQVGVEICLNTPVTNIDSLLADGFDSVLISVGTHKGARIPIPNADAPQVLTNTEFLRGVRMGKAAKIGKRVVVLGGGNVAFDCARSAVRVGAQHVEMACLEAEEKMLADPEEIAQAREEGICIHNMQTFNAIVLQDGAVSGVECSDVASFSFDDNHRLIVIKAEGSEHIIPADTVIFAVGQRSDIPEAFGVAVARRGNVVVDDTLKSSRDGVFASGDAVTGTKSIIDAIVSGRTAASNIDLYLGGDGKIDETLAPVEMPNAYIGSVKEFGSIPRRESQVETIENRMHGFAETDHGFTKEDAACESGRCLQCDLRLCITKPKFWTEYEQ